MPIALGRDFEVADPPTDSISSISFSPAADFLAAGSWDNNVRIYQVGNGGRQTQGMAMYAHQAPVLSVCWSEDGSKLFSAGADHAGRMFDLSTGQSQQIAQHEESIVGVKWVPQHGILVTGSWDKTVKYWDLRTPNPVATVQLPERCYSLDVQGPLMAIATAERHIQIFNLNNPTTAQKTVTSPLKWQTRVVKCFNQSPSGSGIAVGGIDGRIAIQFVDEERNNYTFKCHRKDKTPGPTDQSIYAVNDISFHPVHGTFSTAGSDGTVCIWDRDARCRLQALAPSPGPISASDFNRDGTLFAYAVSYDWSKGHSGMTPGHPNKLMLHAVKEEEVKRRVLARR